MDAVTTPDPAAKQVDAALVELQKALKGLEWSAEFSRLSGDPAAESLTALWQVMAGMGALTDLRRLDGFEVSKGLISLAWPPEGRHYSGSIGGGWAAVIFGGGWAGRSSFSVSSSKVSSGSGSV